MILHGLVRALRCYRFREVLFFPGFRHTFAFLKTLFLSSVASRCRSGEVCDAIF